MKAISLHQPWTQLCVTRQPHPDCATGKGYVAESCDEGGTVKRFETRGWPCPPALIGSRTAIHATIKRPVLGLTLGEWFVCGARDVRPSLARCAGDGPNFPLSLGAVVGSATIEACLPIIDASSCGTNLNGPEHVCRAGGESLLLHHRPLDRPGFEDGYHERDVSDQLPYGDFTPGRYAWLLTDAAPTTERCPWCDGDTYDPSYRGCPAEDGGPDPCPVCDGAGRCDPILARGRQRVWNWTP